MYARIRNLFLILFAFINLSASFKNIKVAETVQKKKFLKSIFTNIAFNHPDCDLEMLQEMKQFFVSFFIGKYKKSLSAKQIFFHEIFLLVFCNIFLKNFVLTKR